MSSFAHLHVHSHYSLLRALPKIPDLVKAAKKEGCTAITLTDRDNLYGAIEFYKQCEKVGIKSIIGVNVGRDGGTRLILLAENNAGYKNLLALITDEHSGAIERGGLFITDEMLTGRTSGIIAIIPSHEGDIPHAIQAGDEDRAKNLAGKYRSLFGANNFFLGYSKHEELERHDDVMEEVRAFAARENIPIVAEQEIYYLAPDDRLAWTTMRAIEQRGPSEDGDIGADEEDFSFHGATEMARLFADTPDALSNTLTISERCNVSIVIGKFIFPYFALPDGVTDDEYLRVLCMNGLHARGLEGKTEVIERLNYELGIIKFKGYAAYFLVVEDLIRFARENNIYTNIRGSVAGSMTTYLLQITKIDPLEYKIPFERFLNPERPSAPDIDMDFADDRRDEVIAYTHRKYGDDRVAQIGTFGTMLARGVVRDVARALGYPYGLGDRVAREIPMGSQGFPMTLERALEENPELAKMYKKDREVKEVIDLGKKIEGCARHVGVHAAGVVIAPQPLVNYTSLQPDPKGGKIITQYDMYSVGEDGVGLTKLDFLGIRNLTILANAVSLIKKLYDVDVDIENIPLDDMKTYAMLASGQTEGTFQLNGPGMTKWLVELRPSAIHDINAMVALYRPGPMQFIPDYIKRKHDPSLISYLDPAMEPILKQTYGILVYQDDLLIMANQFAGYSWGEVDKFRKAVGKKIPEEMAKQKEKFITGCVEYSKWPRAKAEKVWAWIEPFAAYGFNKAHSASYGRVAYQTSYLKANFPATYMSAVLTAESGDVDTVAIMIGECKRMEIPILPPDINESFGVFTVILGSATSTTQVDVADQKSEPTPDSIRFGLYSIKNFGVGIADTIISERKKGGAFISLSDFLRRIKEQALNKKSLEALVQCGALDKLGDRGAMLANTERLLDYHRHAHDDSPQDSLFASIGGEPDDIILTPAPPATMSACLAWEKELLGLFVSGHPLDRIREALNKRPMNIAQITERLKPGMPVITGGIIEKIRIILTKNGDQMCFLTLADYDGSIEAVLFPKTYAEVKQFVIQDACIAIKGRLTSRNNEFSIATEAVKAL